MNKKYLIGGIILMSLIGVAVGINFNSFESAVDYIKQQKANADTPIVFSDVTIISDKVCAVNFETEEIDYCEVCAEYTYNNERHEGCYTVPYETTKAQDITEITGRIEKSIRNAEGQEEVTFTKDNYA